MLYVRYGFSAPQSFWSFLLLIYSRAHQGNFQRTALSTARDVQRGRGQTCRMGPEGYPDLKHSFPGLSVSGLQYSKKVKAFGSPPVDVIEAVPIVTFAAPTF